MKRSAEILSPVGNLDALYAAVINGADAVYFALNKFGARAKADNFTLETAKDAIDYTHVYGVKVYITVNTLLTDSEVSEALEQIRAAWALGADAFIVQDIGLIHEIRRTMPDVVLHASTQMGIHNVEGALFAKELGCKRIVLARETELKDIRAIKAATELELEYFVHGALCIAFSGNCYISSMVSGLSGNRGRCLQLCRKRYRIDCDGVTRDGYYLSPKDLCLLDRIGDLLDAGIDSFKIEGRLRSFAYVAVATRIYRKAVNGQPITDADRDLLKKVFNRGDYCPAYLDGNNVIYPYAQGHIGLPIGKVSAIRNARAKLDTDAPLINGDGVKFMRGKKEVGSARINGNPTTFAGNVAVGDTVCLTASTALSEEEKTRKRKVPISAEINVYTGQPVTLMLRCREKCVTVNGAVAMAATTAPLLQDDIIAIIKKTGDTVFSVEDVIVHTDETSFMPKSALNSLRREACALLYKELTKTERNSYYVTHSTHAMRDTTYSNASIVKESQQTEFSDRLYIVESNDQLNIVCKHIADANIIVSPKEYRSPETITILQKIGAKGILELPVLANSDDMAVLRDLIAQSNVPALCVQNPYGFSLANGRNILVGYGLNCLNSCHGFSPYIQSVEATRIIDPNAYVYAFGKIPLMTYKHCPRKTVLTCKDCRGDYTCALSDDKGSFNVRHYKVSACYAQLLNDKPIYIDDELDRQNHARRIYDLRGCTLDTVRALFNKEPLPHIHMNFNKKLV